MFGVGMPELMIIFVIALLVFGPKELPKIARTLGKAMAELRRASDELRDGIQREIDIATREESGTPSTPVEAVPSTAMVEVSPPATDAPRSEGGEARESLPAGEQEGTASGGPGSPGMAEANLPGSPAQFGEPLPAESNATPGMPAESGHVHVTPEEVLKAEPVETAKRSTSKSETLPPVPVHSAETGNA